MYNALPTPIKEKVRELLMIDFVKAKALHDAWFQQLVESPNNHTNDTVVYDFLEQNCERV